MSFSLKERIFPKPIYLSAPVRSPIGKFGGSLKAVPAPALAGLTLKEAVVRGGGGNLAPADFVMLGHARQAGAGPNPARQAALAAGLADTVPAITVNQACASGLVAVIHASERLALGKARSVWAGGVESMSNTPYLLMQTRWGQKMGNIPVLDGMRQDGFFCPMANLLMGETVENFLVPEFKISREEQDQFALESQQKASRAWESGHFAKETFTVADAVSGATLQQDEHLRKDTVIASLAKLPAVFSKTGTITAGNSSGITDGAAFLHVGLEKTTATYGEILDYEMIALDPRKMGLGPVAAVQNLLLRQGLTADAIEQFELNEAFAAQVIACQRTLKIPAAKVNPFGGSIAIGHPIGATGARILVTLLHGLKGKPGALGVASLCVSGGMGVAVLVRSVG